MVRPNDRAGARNVEYAERKVDFGVGEHRLGVRELDGGAEAARKRASACAQFARAASSDC